MATDYTKSLEQVIRQELLPVYLKHTREPTKQVAELISSLGVGTQAQIPALFKPPKK